MENKIYCLWTGENKMSSQREECFQQFINTCECEVVLITNEKLHEYILPDHPIHAAYEYLSETHKSDYLRTYLMHFYGGGYSDVKKTTGSWKQSFEDLKKGQYWICGYAEEGRGGIAYVPYKDNWRELIGNGAYICKPQTPLTCEWYNDMIILLDEKLEDLKLNPSKHPQDSKSPESNYPIEWNEMLGRIFHRVSYKYKDYLLNTLPISIFRDYR
jgi:hypothetical protein